MKNQAYDKRLEGLRGLCALAVVYAHLVGFNFFDLSKIPVLGFLLHFQFAHIAVQIFFVISGYVMGISHVNTLFTRENVIHYLKKRFVRLYPIYLFALLISLIFGYQFVSPAEITGHAFFLQEFAVKTTITNRSLWSLSFEVVYYLIFIVLWAVNSRSKKLYLFLIILSAFGALFFKSIDCIQALLVGWVFWLLGLYLSQLEIEDESKENRLKPFVTYFLILLATFRLESGGFFMRLLHINVTNERQINLTDLVYLPVCFLIVAGVTRRHLKFINWIQILAYAIPALNIVALIYFRHDIRSNENWLYGTVFFVLGIILLVTRMKTIYFEKLNFVGKMSYAIYIFHFSIAFFLDIGLKQYLSGFPLIIIGFICWFVLTFGLSYLAEIVIQPRIRKIFFKPRLA